MTAPNRTLDFEPLALRENPSLPAHERVLDRLADLLFSTDELLDMVKAEDAMRIRWVEQHLRSVYDELNEVMKRLCN